MQNRVQSERNQQLERAIAEIREKFLLGLDTRVAVLDELLIQVEEADDFRGPMSRISDEAHRISGVAKTLGLSELGQMAGRIENDVHEALGLDHPTPASIASFIHSVDSMLDHMDRLTS